MQTYRTIYLPYRLAEKCSEHDRKRLENHINGLENCFFDFEYYVIDSNSVFLGNSFCSEPSFVRKESRILVFREPIQDIFNVKYREGFYPTPNHIFIINEKEFDSFYRHTKGKLYKNSFIKWDGNSVDFLINNLSTETLKHTWFNETHLLPMDGVMFIDGTDAEINRSIKNQLIQSAALKQPCIFLDDYLPDTNTLLDYLDYYRPDITHKTLQDTFSKTNNIPLLANALKVNFGLETCQYPLLIKSIKTIETNDNGLYSYNIKIFTDNTISEIEIKAFLELKSTIASSRFTSRYALEESNLPYDDPIESNIDDAYRKLSDIIWDKLSYLDKVDAKLMLAEVLRQTLRVNDEKQMLALINSVTPVKLKVSRLVITDSYSLFLPDYSNREVKMGNLPKALYFLFLKHPEGIYLKKIEDYKEELFHLYLKVTNFSDTAKLKHNINMLTDLQDNSLYVNMARIKAGFTKVMDDAYAQNYYPKGDYAVPKKIALDQSLIDLPANF